MAQPTAAYADLARTLPPRLLRFFARYPPQSIIHSRSSAAKTAVAAAASSSSSSASTSASTTHDSHGRTFYQNETPNPFQQTKHAVTQRWHDPIFSLRRQADLVKMAREHGVESLLPATSKKTETKLTKRVALGSRIKGTGVGQKVKGHKHERVLEEKMEKRREAMLGMPSLIRKYKKLGKNRWKEWPKGNHGIGGSRGSRKRR